MFIDNDVMCPAISPSKLYELLEAVKDLENVLLVPDAIDNYDIYMMEKDDTSKRKLIGVLEIGAEAIILFKGNDIT